MTGIRSSEPLLEPSRPSDDTPTGQTEVQNRIQEVARSFLSGDARKEPQSEGHPFPLSGHDLVRKAVSQELDESWSLGFSEVVRDTSQEKKVESLLRESLEKHAPTLPVTGLPEKAMALLRGEAVELGIPGSAQVLLLKETGDHNFEIVTFPRKELKVFDAIGEIMGSRLTSCTRSEQYRVQSVVIDYLKQGAQGSKISLKSDAKTSRLVVVKESSYLREITIKRVEGDEIWVKAHRNVGSGGFKEIFKRVSVRDGAATTYVRHKKARRYLDFAFPEILKRELAFAEMLYQKKPELFLPVRKIATEKGEKHYVLFCAGGSLYDAIRTKRLKKEQILPFCQDLLEGLACIHELGFVHGDVKPLNCLLKEDGRLALIDFDSTEEIGAIQRTYTKNYIDARSQEFFEKGLLHCHPANDIYAAGRTISELVDLLPEGAIKDRIQKYATERMMAMKPEERPTVEQAREELSRICSEDSR